ncbi:hypothetical protein D9M69_325450 [compost metagenome]
MDRAGVLAQDLHGNGALARDHLGIVERVDEGQLVLLLQLGGMVVGIAVGLAVQLDLDPLAAALAHRVDLYLRRGHRHGDDGLALQPGRGQRHALGMVAGRRRDHAAPEFLRRQRGHLVVRAAQLEREHRLGVFSLEPDRVAGARRQLVRIGQFGLLRHVVDLGGQDFLQVVGAGGGRAGHGVRAGAAGAAQKNRKFWRKPPMIKDGGAAHLTGAAQPSPAEGCAGWTWLCVEVVENALAAGPGTMRRGWPRTCIG